MSNCDGGHGVRRFIIVKNLVGEVDGGVERILGEFTMGDSVLHI